MASSGYTAITFVASEQPTTAKWNLIGSNDASFNNGNGFEDDIIVNRHIAADAVLSEQLNVIGAADANGWTIIDLGTTKIYKKRVTFSQTIGGLAVLSISSSNLPVGVATIGTRTFQYSLVVTGNAGVLQVTAEMSSGSSFLNFTTARTDGSSSGYNGFLDVVIIE